jgi:hypothetical protein
MVKTTYVKVYLCPLIPEDEICGEQERENVENVRVRIAQLTTSVELGRKVL